MKNKTVGFYITLLAAILSIVACVLHINVMYTLPVVYVFCVAAVVLTLIVIAASVKKTESKIYGLLPVANAILMASAAVWGVNLMVNELGYVVAGLDSFDSIISFVIFEAFALVSMILNIVASFMKQYK